MKTLLSILLPVSFLISCSPSIKVISDQDDSVDFSKYGRIEYYGWEKQSDSVMTRFDRERIEKAFGNEFRRRGYSIVEKGQGDLIITLYILVESKTSTTANTTHTGGYGGYYGYGPGYGWGGGYSTTYIDTYDYKEGTLMVSAYDKEKKVLVWQAAGKGIIKERSKNPERDINTAVNLIMLKYPVKPIK